MANKLGEIVESRLASISENRKKLVEGWNPYIKSINKFLMEREKRVMTDYEAQQVAQVLENAMIESGLRSRSRIFETTYQDNISFLGVN